MAERLYEVVYDSHRALARDHDGAIRHGGLFLTNVPDPAPLNVTVELRLITPADRRFELVGRVVQSSGPQMAVTFEPAAAAAVERLTAYLESAEFRSVLDLELDDGGPPTVRALPVAKPAPAPRPQRPAPDTAGSPPKAPTGGIPKATTGGFPAASPPKSVTSGGFPVASPPKATAARPPRPAPSPSAVERPSVPPVDIHALSGFEDPKTDPEAPLPPPLDASALIELGQSSESSGAREEDLRHRGLRGPEESSESSGAREEDLRHRGLRGPEDTVELDATLEGQSPAHTIELLDATIEAPSPSETVEAPSLDLASTVEARSTDLAGTVEADAAPEPLREEREADDLRASLEHAPAGFRTPAPGETYIVYVVRFHALLDYVEVQPKFLATATLTIPVVEPPARSKRATPGDPCQLRLQLPGRNHYHLYAVVEEVGEDRVRVRVNPIDPHFQSACAFPGTTAGKKRLERETADDRRPLDVLRFEETRDVEEGGDRVPMRLRLARMGMEDKINLALSGGREERRALALDGNKAVHHYLLRNAKLTVEEVAFMAGLATLNPDVLQKIAENSNYTQNPQVVRNLVYNPKTPLPTAIRLLDRLPRSEIQNIAKRTSMNMRLVMAAKKKIGVK